MFCAKNGNVSYTTRVLGTATERLDKCIFGVLISTVILFLLVGPLVFFSDVGGFVAPNPVLSADIKVALVITKTLNSTLAPVGALALASAAAMNNTNNTWSASGLSGADMYGGGFASANYAGQQHDGADSELS